MVKLLRFENVILPDNIGFKCKSCGRCCREQSADVTIEEENRIQDLGFTNFLEATDLTEPRLIRTGKSGGCLFLNESNQCSVQDVKPVICRLVPFVVTDWNYEKNLIEVDLPVDCDCPGVFEGSDLPTEELGKAAQLFVQNLLEANANEEGLPTTNVNVLSKTRLRIIRLAIDELV